MIKFNNMEKYVREDKEVTIRFKDYKIKEPSVIEWLKINTFDFSMLDKKFRDTADKLIKIMIPNLNIDNLTNQEIWIALSGCLEVLLNKREETEEEKTVSSNDEVYISFDYILAKYCRYMNTSLKEALSTNVFVFFNALEGIEAVIAEESLRNAEIYDNHIHLKNRDGNEKYRKTLDKYRNTFQDKGVKVIQSMDFSGLQKLKAMLGGN